MAPAKANVTTRSRDRATRPAARSTRAARRDGRGWSADQLEHAAAHEWKVDVHRTPEMPDIWTETFHSCWCVAAPGTA